MVKLAKSAILSKLNLALFIVFLASCATSMSPVEVNNALPALTKAKFISEAQAQELAQRGSCKYLVKNRKYAAPMGLSTKDDLKKGAKGIDEWVKIDGGNAYVLKNYKWIAVDQIGSTQLHIDFDTMRCD